MPRQFRKPYATAVVAAGALVLAACGGDGGGDTGGGGGGGDEPLRIAVVTSQAGPYASIGQQAIEAGEFAEMWFNERGGIDGRQLEVVIIDDQGTPEGAVAGVEQAILQEDAPFITGTVASSQSLAIAAQIESLDGVYVASISKTDKLTGEACNPRVFRANARDTMDLNTVEPWLEERPERTWSAIGADYEWGHDSVGRFKEELEALGGQVLSEQYPPLGETDYGPYITQAGQDGAEGLWVSLSGGDSVTFINQAAPFGLFDQKSVVIGNNFITDAGIEAVGELAEGLWGTVNYHHSLDTAMNQEFVEAWQEAHPTENPTNFHGETFMAIQMIAAGVEAAGSVDPAEVADAMNDLEVETLLGTSTIRGATGQLLRPNYLGQVVPVEGGYDWEIKSEVPASVAAPEPDPDYCTAR